MRLDHIIVSVHNLALNIRSLESVSCTVHGLTDTSLIKIGNKMPVAIVER